MKPRLSQDGKFLQFPTDGGALTVPVAQTVFHGAADYTYVAWMIGAPEIYWYVDLETYTAILALLGFEKEVENVVF